MDLVELVALQSFNDGFMGKNLLGSQRFKNVFLEKGSYIDLEDGSYIELEDGSYIKLKKDGYFKSGTQNDIIIQSTPNIFYVNLEKADGIELPIYKQAISSFLDVEEPTERDLIKYLLLFDADLNKIKILSGNSTMRDYYIHTIAEGIKEAAYMKIVLSEIIDNALSEAEDNGELIFQVHLGDRKIVTSSLLIAKKFEMSHSDVMKRIRFLIAKGFEFDLTSYIYFDTNFHIRNAFLLTEHGLNLFLTPSIKHANPNLVNQFKDGFNQKKLVAAV